MSDATPIEILLVEDNAVNQKLALRLLQHGCRSERFDHRAHFRCLMTDHGEHLRGFQRLASSHDVLDQRSSACEMQYFRKFGTHARAFTGSENHDCGIFSGHIVNIVASRTVFGKRITGGRRGRARTPNWLFASAHGKAIFLRRKWR